MRKQKQALVIQLSKAPVLGCVKSRMQPELDPSQSVYLHKWLTEWCVKSLCSNSGWKLKLCADMEHPFFEELAGKYAVDLCYQTDGDLGQRLTHISELHKNSALCLIGSDCPFLDERTISEVFLRLSDPKVDVVVVPADDGGYVCLALNQHEDALFRDISWGSESVCMQTLERAKDAGLHVALLPSLPDIDRPDDLPLLKDIDFPFSNM